jgi:hypothetical protein
MSAQILPFRRKPNRQRLPIVRVCWIGSPSCGVRCGMMPPPLLLLTSR